MGALGLLKSLFVVSEPFNGVVNTILRQDGRQAEDSQEQGAPQRSHIPIVKRRVRALTQDDSVLLYVDFREHTRGIGGPRPFVPFPRLI
jgi:hypothetical protein